MVKTCVQVLAAAVLLCMGSSARGDDVAIMCEIIGDRNEPDKQRLEQIGKLAKLGAKAKAGVPTLVKVLKEAEDAKLHGAAAAALLAIHPTAPDALPVVLKNVSDMLRERTDKPTDLDELYVRILVRHDFGQVPKDDAAMLLKQFRALAWQGADKTIKIDSRVDDVCGWMVRAAATDPALLGRISLADLTGYATTERIYPYKRPYRPSDVPPPPTVLGPDPLIEEQRKFDEDAAKDKSVGVKNRVTAIRLVGQLGTPEAKSWLRRLTVRDTDPEYKAAAKKALDEAQKQPDKK